jgi:uncharacterized CHY-type Zn-finger protein
MLLITHTSIAMSDQMLAYCGLVCTECNTYIASKNDDDELRRKTAEQWSRPDYPISPEEINCDGCKTETGELWKWCPNCEVRACAIEKGVETCAHCDDFGCDTLEKFLKMSGEELRKKLNEIHASLA